LTIPSILRRRSFVVGLLLVGVVSLGAGLADWLAPFDPVRNNFRYRLGEPNDAHLLGTDRFGRDVLSRILYGARVSLRIGIMVVLASGVIGGLVGLVAGWWPKLDGWLMRVMDGLMAFPGILLAIAVVVSLGARFSSVVLALTLVYIPVVARLVRSMTLVIRELPYVESARSIGVSNRVILWRYILANSVSPLIVQATFIAAYAILSEASLSFLGASINPELPTWGNMLRDGQRLVTTAWWMAVPPGAVLFLTVLACTLLGDALRDALDPRARERQEDGFLT
jgi:peptide/nickel transport system permease protein